MKPRRKIMRDHQKKLASPRFALPEHQWVPNNICYTMGREVIREHNGWALVRRPKPKLSAEGIDKQLKAPGSGLSALMEKKFPSGELFKETHVAIDILNNLAKAIQVRLAVNRPSDEQIAEIHDAAGILYWLVSRGCQALMEIAKQNPQCLQPIAKKETSWPLMMSTKPGYSTNHMQLLDLIILGHEADWDMDCISRADTKRSPAEIYMKNIAEKLFHTLDWARINKLDREPLQPFSSDDEVFAAWWKAAEAIFLEAYPKPHEQPELVQYAPPSRKYPAQKRASILNKIKAAFLNLAKSR